MTKINSKLLGSNLKTARENAKLEKQDIAVFLGTDKKNISGFENATSMIGADMLERLSALFCIPVQTLLSETVKPDANALHLDVLPPEDRQTVADLNRIILNQMEMDEILNHAGKTHAAVA